MKYFISVFFVLTVSLSLGAHALWINTDPEGKIGQEHTVEILYEEFADGTVEKIPDWYSDVQNFELWLIQPNGQKIQLNYRESGDRFVTSFTPTLEGIYHLIISHEAKDLGNTTKYQFNAQAIVRVNQKIIDTEYPNELSVIPRSMKNKVKRKVNIQSLFRGAPNSDVHVTVFSPSGWNKVLLPDENGVITFTPLWKGNYMIEATHYNASEDGTHHQQEFNSVWRCATIQIPIH